MREDAIREVMRWHRSRAVAEDVVGEANLKAFRNIDKFDPTRKLSSWYITIVKRCAIDELRRKRTRSGVIGYADNAVNPLGSESEDGSLQSLLESIADPLGDPSKVLDEEPEATVEGVDIISERLTVALARLPHFYRRVLIHKAEGRDIEEIAEVEGVSCHRVRAVLAISRSMMREFLAT